MESGSETESDVSLSPGHRYSTQPNNAYIHPPSGTVTETLQSTDDPPRNTTDDWTQAIRYLFDLRMEGVDWESDTILQEQLREASGVLMRTLEEIATPRHLDSDRLAYLAGFLTNSLQDEFMDKLFVYRHVFHTIARRSLSPGMSASIVFCWVDVILVKISEAVVSLASRLVGEELKEDTSGKLSSLDRQKEEAALSAAAQLPREWSSVHTRLGSQHASPAMQRLALQLVFASCVIVPQMTGTTHERNLARLQSLLSPLEQYLIRLSGHEHSDDRCKNVSGPVDVVDKDSLAMSLVLFSVADSSPRHTHRPNSPLSHRPYTQSLILQAIHYLMQDSVVQTNVNVIFPRECINPSIRILIHWGEFVPWCWSTWPDNRDANYGTILYLTVTWLYHLDNTSESWTADLSKALVFAPESAGLAIMNILRNGVELSCPEARIPQSALIVLRKCAWAAARLLSTSPDVGSTPFARGMASCLVPLFILSHADELSLSLKDYFLEALPFVHSDVLQDVVRNLQEDKRLSLGTRLESMLQRLGGIVKKSRSTGASLQQDIPHLTHILHFFSILWYNQAPVIVHPTSISSLLARLLDVLSESPALYPALLSTLLSTTWGDVATFCQLALYSRHNKIQSAATLASYVAAVSKQITTDPLTCAEITSAMTSVLLLTVTNRILADELPLALLVSPSLCRALVTLIRVADDALAYYITTSPWMLSLCGELNAILLASEEGLSTERLILKQRLHLDGDLLFTEVTQRNAKASPGPKKLPAATSSLIYYRHNGSPHLVTVIQSDTEL